MAKITTGQSFNAGDQLTSTKLNNIVGSAFLDSDSITGSTLNLNNGQLKVATNGITDNELNTDSVTTAKIANDAVTYAKIQEVAASSVIGNTTASAANPTNVAILDEDDMASDSDTSLVTQKSVKAYVDSQVTGSVSKYSTGWQNSIDSVTVGNNSTHTITHSLGTTNVTVAVYVNSSGSDTNAQLVPIASASTAGHTGYAITHLATNSFTLQLANGYPDLGTDGLCSTTNYTSQFLKIVVIG